MELNESFIERISKPSKRYVKTNNQQETLTHTHTTEMYLSDIKQPMEAAISAGVLHAEGRKLVGINSSIRIKTKKSLFIRLLLGRMALSPVLLYFSSNLLEIFVGSLPSSFVVVTSMKIILPSSIYLAHSKQKWLNKMLATH